jgi:hypothetical protein
MELDYEIVWNGEHKNKDLDLFRKPEFVEPKKPTRQTAKLPVLRIDAKKA